MLNELRLNEYVRMNLYPLGDDQAVFLRRYGIGMRDAPVSRHFPMSMVQTP